MARLLWAIPCSRVLTDLETNTVSYIDTVEQFGVPQVPYPFPPVVVGTLWERDLAGEEIQIQLRLVGPDGQQVRMMRASMQHATAMRHRANVPILGADIASAGRYQIAVDVLDGEAFREVYRVPLDIQIVPPEQQAPA